VVRTCMSAPSGYKQSVAVPLPSDGGIRAVIGEDYDPDTTLNVVKIIGVVRAIFGTPDIDDKHREMIILRAASILDVPYEWQANKVMASNAGLTDTEIEAVSNAHTARDHRQDRQPHQPAWLTSR
jgi:hypothetical protein